MRKKRNSWVFLLLVITPVFAFCQSETVVSTIPNCSISRIKPKASKLKPISAGVLNGRAILLVKPVYPAAAKSVKVQGTVEISILIDESGCVTEAKYVSGHPLLTASSLKAARASSFEPVLLSGNPIRVQGVIVYNYRLDLMNWLELGFSSNDYDTVLEYLPAGFDVEAKLLRQSKDLPWDEKQEILESVKKGLLRDLATDSKNQWLFSVGMWLRSFHSIPWKGDYADNAFAELRLLLDSMPLNVSPKLKVELSELMALQNANDINAKLKFIELRFFDLGN